MLKGEVIAAFLILARLDEFWAPSTHHDTQEAIASG